MLGILLPVLMGVLLYAILRRQNEPDRVMQLFLGAYALRMVLQSFIRELPVFSHGAGGGDCGFYEWLAWSFARLWSQQGIELLTPTNHPEVGTATLPLNLFAFIIYLNGDSTRAGCTSIVAFCAVSVCYQLYSLACELGAEEKQAYKVSAVLLFLPGYLFYTSDMYKDGIVLFLVVTALSASFRLARRFSLIQIGLAVMALSGLWFVRYYLIFLCIAPLVVGLLGLGKGSIFRQVISVGAAVMVLVIVMQTSALSSVSESVQSTFERASNVSTRQWNQLGGSGVSFDDGGNAFGALHLKLLYTLFSPFPWQGGSFALQMGKLDAAVWYYLFWRAIKAGRRLWSVDRPQLFMYLVFLVPLTVAYATTMANIGLILRQRLPIIYVGCQLAMLGWPARGSAKRAAPRPRPALS